MKKTNENHKNTHSIENNEPVAKKNFLQDFTNFIFVSIFLIDKNYRKKTCIEYDFTF